MMRIGRNYINHIELIECIILNHLNIDSIVLNYMYKYGIERVRGGSFSEIELSKAEINIIKKMIYNNFDLCYDCNGAEHFPDTCPLKKNY